jgi:hypothetical protein
MMIVDRLNELLEAERAGVKALSRLLGEALTEMRTRHRANIEACNRLAESRP